MRIDFQAVLTEYFFAKKSLNLPGLGTLRLREDSPSLDPTTNTFDPPAVQLTFSQDSTTTTGLINYVAEKLDLVPKDVQSSFANWLKGIKQSLKNGKDVYLKDLGILKSKTKEGIVFDVSKDVFKGYPGLPGVVAVPIKRAASAEVTKYPVLNETSEMRESILPIFILSLLILGMAWLISWPGFESSSLKPDPIKTENDRININPEYDTVLASEKDTGSHEYEDPQEGRTPLDVEKVDESTDEITEDEIRLDEENTEEILDQALGKECVIVLGAFSNINNAQRLKERIVQLGYTPYEEDYKGLKRIGVRFDCLEKDLYTTLFQLRGKFTEDAWILKYD